MQILANQRRETFALLVASGASSHAEAYRTVYSKNPKASQANAARLMANDSIAARIEELRAMSATAATLTMQQRREIAAAIARDTTARASNRLAAIMADARLAGELKGEATAAASVTVGVAVNVGLGEEERREGMAAKAAGNCGTGAADGAGGDGGGKLRSRGEQARSVSIMAGKAPHARLLSGRRLLLCAAMRHLLTSRLTLLPGFSGRVS